MMDNFIIKLNKTVPTIIQSSSFCLSTIQHYKEFTERQLFIFQTFKLYSFDDK